MLKIPPPKPKITLPSRIILVHTKPDLRFLVKALELSPQKSLFLTEIFGREELFICGPVLGAPQTAIILEYLKAAGVKEILTLGWAGALKEDLLLGSIFLPEKALSAEGTSAHYGYFPYPSRALFWWLYHELVAQGLVFQVGTIVSTDALFREDEDFCRRFSEAQAVDMETAALFSVAKALGLSLASLLLISDSLVPVYQRAKAKDLKNLLNALLPLLRTFGSKK